MTFPVLSANGPSGYNLTRSLRTRSSASAYLRRVPASSTNVQKFTLSMWRKIGTPADANIAAANQDTLYALFDQIQINASGNLIVQSGTLGVSFTWTLTSVALFRDPASWYHVVVAYDTTQATSTNRVKVWVNNQQLTFTGTYPAQNYSTAFNTTTPQYISQADGYSAEVNWVDGQQLTPSSFGSTNSTTGVWQPAKYTGTYGTNGFYLPFTDNSALTTASNAGLGKDFSGNANYWVTNNISITAGATYDSMTDVPTLTSATASNYPTLNPIGSVGNGIYSSANLDFTSGASAWATSLSTIGASSGKWYCEITITTLALASNFMVGAATSTSLPYGSYIGAVANGWGVQYGNAGSIVKFNNSTSTIITTGTIVAGDILQVAIDVDNGRIWFGKNNTYAEGSPSAGTGASFTTLTGTILFGVSTASTGDKVSANFGQRPLTYSAPTGFSTLNTYNLPASTVPNGAAYMAATLYTGTGASLTVANTVGSASFQPDLVWIKSRSAATNHKLTDSVRGVTKGLVSNTTAAETTDTQGLTAFGSTGFTVGTNTDYNNSGATYVAWQWKGGGTAVSNTNGSITSSVSANTTSGCSVVTYTGTGANATVGHGLGVAPSMIITKKRSSTSDWGVYHTSIGNTNYLLLDTTAASAASSTYWNNTTPTSSVFSISTADAVNISTATYVAYCFAAIKGFSAFGSYTGNGSATDGPFVYTGFRPRYVLIKRTDASTGADWFTYDTSRNPYNTANLLLFSNLSDAEAASGGSSYLDIVSNGFKARGSSNGINVSAATYIYMAFAESPFQNSLAR